MGSLKSQTMITVSITSYVVYSLLIFGIAFLSGFHTATNKHKQFTDYLRQKAANLQYLNNKLSENENSREKESQTD